jgi:predicted dehydrogenase
LRRMASLFIASCRTLRTDESTRANERPILMPCRVSRARVVVVCITDPREIRWTEKIPEYGEFATSAYDFYDDMPKYNGLNAVWISTSTDVYESHSIGAITKGLHMLCETPLRTSMVDVPYFTTCSTSQTNADARPNPWLMLLMPTFD